MQLRANRKKRESNPSQTYGERDVTKSQNSKHNRAYSKHDSNYRSPDNLTQPEQ
jgi:hypothetical protein